MMISLAFLLLLATDQPPVRDPAELAVDQLAQPRGNSADIRVDDLGAPDGRAAVSVSQLPEDLEADDAAAESEPSLASQDKTDLTGEVARAFELIRERGQQPTPELIAREIGPDRLAAYLNQNPEGVDIFTRDALPDPTQSTDPDLTTGGVIVLPPSDGL